MTAEAKLEDAELATAAAAPAAGVEQSKVVDGAAKLASEEEKASEESAPAVMQKSSSFVEERSFVSDLKDHERKALMDLRAKVEEAILGNTLFARKEKKPTKEKRHKGEKKPQEEEEEEEEEEAPQKAGKDEQKEAGEEEKAVKEEKKEEEEKDENREEKKLEEKAEEDEEKIPDDAKPSDLKPEDPADAGISLWGVPLLPSKGSEKTDVVLLKFLRAREFKVKESFEMLANTLQWRKEAHIDSLLEESLGEGLEAAAYMDGVDREGHPVCYNIYGVFQDSAVYEKAFGSEEKVEKFLRWRFQMMEKGIQNLDFRPGGVASILQISDLKNSPGLSRKELRNAMQRALGLLQDNYPEFVAKNIIINVPFWYYALNALLSPFLTQRTKNKFVVVRPSKVTETLLKYIPAHAIPVQYGGLRRENDDQFSGLGDDGGVSELVVKPGSVENIEIPVPEVGSTTVWDLAVVGWEVNYKEEFVPSDEGSYTILLQKGKKMGAQEEPVRNSFKNSEPGKVVLIIENATSRKKKVLVRRKVRTPASSS